MNGGWQVSVVFFKASLIALLTVGMGVVQAHPHLRLAYQLTPMLSQDSVTAVQVSWQMDHMNTALVRENIDLNQNGLLDADELAAFAKTNQDLMVGFNYFMTIEDGLLKTPLAFEVKEFSARDAGRGFQGGIYLEFTAVLKNAHNLNSLNMQMQDPTWFIGFEPRMGRVLAAASDCDSSFTREKRLTPSQGEQEVQRIHIQCASGSPAQPNAQVSPTTELTNGDNT
jgi:ABC-type uncharacterized transport system substrate-binding protein